MDAVETFTEYGISYRGQAPRVGSWTPDYEVAVRDAAYRIEIHGADLGPIEILERTTTITSTPWRAAVRPEIEPEELAHSRHQSTVEKEA